MATIAVEHTFTGSTIKYSDPYDSSKTVLGKWIVQNTGVNDSDKYAGPFPVVCARPIEESASRACTYPHVIDVGNNTHWVFLAENSAAAVTRTIVLYRFNTATQVCSWRGVITLTYPTATAHTIRGLRVQRHLYTTGTVAVSGTAVTGTSTAWQTARYAVGGRIGFGSTDPNAITTWYYITAISSDTSITLSYSAGTISAGTAFVIEELRIITVTTNATTTNGGLYVAKGINYDDFVIGGTTVAAATTTDNVKAVYWLTDAATALNIAAGGIGLGTASDTSQIVYVINADAASTLRVYKYDIRVALSGLSAGKSTSAFLYRTGANTVPGTISQTNSSRLATLNHGPGAGTSCLYLATTTRILRCPESAIMDGSPSIVSDCLIENPTGGTNVMPAISYTSVEYAGTIDRLLIGGSATQRNYVASYQNFGEKLELNFGSSTNNQDQSLANPGSPTFPHFYLNNCAMWSEDGILYMLRTGITSPTNQLYILPFSADWNFAASTNGRLISKKILTPNCIKYKRFSAVDIDIIGSNSLGLPPECWRTFYRTNGIDDNTGNWTAMDAGGNLSSVSGAPAIQFMFEFRIIGPMSLSAKIYAFSVTYEDDSTDDHFRFSMDRSSSVNNLFVWKFVKGFGTNVPALAVKLYDAVTNTLLLKDFTTNGSYGVWQKSTDGCLTWSAYSSSDKSNETTYIRYAPTSLSYNVKIRSVLTSISD